MWNAAEAFRSVGRPRRTPTMPSDAALDIRTRRLGSPLGLSLPSLACQQLS